MAENSPAPTQVLAEAPVQEPKPAAKPVEKIAPTPSQIGETDSARIAREDSDRELDAKAHKSATALKKDGDKVVNPADEAAANDRAIQEARAEFAKYPASVQKLIPELHAKVMSKEMTQAQAEQHLNQALIDAKVVKATQTTEHPIASDQHDNTISSQASTERPGDLKDQDTKAKTAGMAEALERLENNPVFRVLKIPLKVIGTILGIPGRFLQWALAWIKK